MSAANKCLVGILLLSAGMTEGYAQKGKGAALWESPAYTLYADSVVQGKFTARALSREELHSNYQSPANEFKSSAIDFKFSINGKDNEMLSGTDHHFNFPANTQHASTPLIVFGKPLKALPNEKPGFLQAGSTLTLRLDLREVLKAFNTQGYYTTFDGNKLYKDDFKGVYVAGSSAPLIWDFDNLVNHPHLQLKDADKDGIYEITLSMDIKEAEKQTASTWKGSKDLSAYPEYQSPHTLPDLLYRLSIEEMVNAIEPDSTLRTGKEWAGVWTRDVSYSIILAMAHLQPRVAKNSLLRKVSAKKKIIQDTGTGGAWPVSTDRQIWAVAAWELYKVTGDKDWLQEAYTIIKNSIDDDGENIYDPATGLVKGESSFLDWRDQTYPKWMQPADIFESECLGTNAVHYQALKVLGTMAEKLEHASEAQQYLAKAEKLKAGINTYLWLPAQQYYGQYLYGRTNKIVSPRAEALGEALSILFDIAETGRARQIIRHTPVSPYGIPCISPQIPNIPPYHNNGIWPFVQAYWMLAAAKAGNETAVMESMAAIYRPAALFATNKENFVAENGDFSGTQINSSNMLWSLSGNIAIVHKVLFGIQFLQDGLGFAPFVPQALSGKRTLHNFKYRDAVLNITIEGFGNTIRQFLLDGKPQEKWLLSASIKGQHEVIIYLGNQPFPASSQEKAEVQFTPVAPLLQYQQGKLSWQPVKGAVKYRVLQNGKLLKEQTVTRLAVTASRFAEFQVIAVAANGLASFASEPLRLGPEAAVKLYEAETVAAPASLPYSGYTGQGFVEVSTTQNTTLAFPVTVEQDGDYLVELRYANGNGPTNTENKCAIRAVAVDGQQAGTVVLPQRGRGEWSNWGYSNSVKVSLKKGSHTISINYQDFNENMNGAVNQAMIDHLRLTKL
ncbi:MAG: amylo-alpha-1,6-glucosidase [Candidatus Pseudobacter hemicellulosilyticus]|uniref:Amylo-alpha-1,6-glucosidase n=1 Tax=Candidatus Pseudobacter hemicellulosilyticus TaxID=3121375 RepID=A0AAJ5WUZ8_9BACT|nr:MAG: amylo-alpha-1,6-glucosidase [Pseudobacter sp.]